MSCCPKTLLFLLLLAGGCSSVQPPPQSYIYPDDHPIPRPKKRKPSLVVEILDKSISHQIKQLFDLPRTVRKLVGHPYQALNVDAFDEVPNSTWFTNRNGTAPMSLEEIRRGPNQYYGPDTTGAWTVLKLKSTDAIPGLTIVDARGHQYLIKFDPPEFSELPSGTQTVAAKLLYAAGYNVPENYVVWLDPKRLQMATDAVLSVGTNDNRAPTSKRSMARADLQRLLERANPQGQPLIRALASRALPGIPVGPWSYKGIRRDDPNDIYLHEHRREIRGFYIIASWLNHANMKEENTQDMYDPQARFLTHYLTNFDGSIGSNSTRPSNPRRGQANSFDLKDSLIRLVTLGLYVHDYERAPRSIPHPSVGYLGNDLFKPRAWKAMYPVPAFENMTRRDAFWGTKIVTSFTNEQIAAAVSTGAYSNPAAASSMTRFLIERRDRIGHYWFARLNTLDRFKMADYGTLEFTDLAVARGYADSAETRYRCQVFAATGATLFKDKLKNTVLTLDPAWRQHAHIAVALLAQRPHYSARPILVYLQAAEKGWRIIGLRRRD